jgi:hypothetical protein
VSIGQAAGVRIAGRDAEAEEPIDDGRSRRTTRPRREPVREIPRPKLKNYITPAGWQRLKDEHRVPLNRERPAVTQVVRVGRGQRDRSENATTQRVGEIVR